MDLGGGRSLLPKLGLGVLAFNSAAAVYRSWGDAASVAFVLSADAALLLLFHFLRRFERAPPPARGRAKAAVWALSTLLTAMFASRVAALVPPPVGAAVWAVAAATAAGGFWALFVSR